MPNVPQGHSMQKEWRQNMDELFILTNSPGEVSGWVRPVVSELTLMGFAAKVSLVLLPCQYASGMEAKCGLG